MFDLDAALAAIKQRNDATRDEWDEFQRSERAKVAEGDPKELYAHRAIATASRKLGEIDPDSPEAHIQFDRMAEGYYLLGEIETAAAVAHNEAQRERYEAVLEALKRSDDEQCSCPKRLNGNDTWVVTEKIGKVTILRCAICRFENAQC